MASLNRKHIFLFIGASLVVYSLISFSNINRKNLTSRTDVKPKLDTRCYRQDNASEASILDANPSRGKSIFFIETSCSSAKIGRIALTSRQACAIESAARLNPKMEIWVLFVSPGVVRDEGVESDKFVQSVLSFDNVRIRHIDMAEYFKGTLVENLWVEGRIEASPYVYSHTSDVLRFLTLWRYGGIYLDLDLIMMRSLEDLPLNFVSIESDRLVGSTVMSFAPDGIGHELAEMCLQDLHSNFDGNQWTNNGPGVATRLGLRICGKETVPEVFGLTCHNFTFYPPSVFLPISWEHWDYFFDMKHMEKVETMSQNSYSVHIWNNLNMEKRTRKGEESPHTILSKKYCPKVFAEVREYF